MIFLNPSSPEMNKQDVPQNMLEQDGTGHPKYLSWKSGRIKRKICGALAVFYMS